MYNIETAIVITVVKVGHEKVIPVQYVSPYFQDKQKYGWRGAYFTV